MKEKIELNFKDIFEATGFVLIDVTFKERTLTFLVDSGSDINLIDIDLIQNKDKFEIKESSCVSLHGKKKVEKIQGNFTFNIDEFEYADVFTATDMTNFKETMKNLFGIDAAGIIGSHFLKTKNVIINYEDCTLLMDAYPEKEESNNNNLKTE